MVERLLFVESLKNTYLAFAAINALAVIPSLLQINIRIKVEKSGNSIGEAVPIGALLDEFKKNQEEPMMQSISSLF